MSSLLELFDCDFKEPGFQKTILFSKETVENRVVKSSGEIIEIKHRIIQDANSWVRLFIFYIPKTSDTLLVCKSLIFEYENLKSEIEDLDFSESFLENQSLRKYDVVYSKRIFIYSDLQISPKELWELDRLCKSKDLHLEFRSTDYARKKMESIFPYAFISYDEKDKELVTRPLAQGLKSRLCNVLYEDYVLNREIEFSGYIEKGIREAKRCILIVSPNFLTNLGGRGREFDAIFTPERIYNERIVLPIWVNVSKEQVYDYLPSIADTFGLVWPSAGEIEGNEYKKEVQILISRLHTQIASIEGFHGFR